MEFSKEISVNGVPTICHFEQANEDDNTFLVTLEGAGDGSYAFTMKPDKSGIWRAQPDIPGFTSHEALQLSNAIDDELDKADEETKRAENFNPRNILGS